MYNVLSKKNCSTLVSDNRIEENFSVSQNQQHSINVNTMVIIRLIAQKHSH